MRSISYRIGYKVKPYTNSVEVHPQLSNNRHPVDGVAWVSVHCGQHLKHKAPGIREWAFDCFKKVMILAGDLPPRH